MAIAKMDINEIYTNILLISIANRCDLGQLAKTAEMETLQYISDHKQNSSHLFQALPEGFDGLYFMESLARKVGGSLGEAYFLTQERKEEIIINLLKKISPIEEAYCEYYDDSVEDQIEFKGEVRFIDLSDESMVEKFYRAKGKGNEEVDKDLIISYEITFQRIIEEIGAEKVTHYSLYLSANRSFLSQYIYDDYSVWDGTDGLIADFIDKVISVHEKASESDSEREVDNDPSEIVYSIIPYKKAIDSDTKAITQRAYIKVGKENAAPSFLPVRINIETHSIHIPFQLYADHIDELKKGRLSLCESFRDEGYVIRTVLLPINDNEENMATDILSNGSEDHLSNDESMISVIDLPAEAKDLYTIRPYTGTVRSMTDNKTVVGYVLVNHDGATKHFVPVIVDDLDNALYIYKPHYKDNKTFFSSCVLQLYDAKGTETRSLKIDTKVLSEEPADTDITGKPVRDDASSERSTDPDIRDDKSNINKEENVIVAKKRATVIKALKSGDLCPACGRPNANPEMIEVVDTNGNARTIIGLQCICGTVYLTKKQYKKISNKAHLKIIEVNAPKMTATTSKQVMIKNNPDPRIDHGRNKIRMARGCVKCGKGPIAVGALSKGLRLCWECYKEEMSSTYDY